METKAYEDHVNNRWRGSNSLDIYDLYVMTAGLAGETGEVMEHLKKNVRDDVLNLDELKLELGDVLFYLTKITTTFGSSLDEIMELNVAKLNGPKKVHAHASS